MPDAQTKAKLLGRLRRLQGQVQGIQRMVEEDKPCADIVLQLAAVRGAALEVSRLLLREHVEAAVAEAFRSGSARERQKKMDEVLEAFARFSFR